jgi:hypothetical protein
LSQVVVEEFESSSDGPQLIVMVFDDTMTESENEEEGSDDGRSGDFVGAATIDLRVMIEDRCNILRQVK